MFSARQAGLQASSLIQKLFPDFIQHIAPTPMHPIGQFGRLTFHWRIQLNCIREVRNLSKHLRIH